MSQTKAQLISDLVQALNFTGTSSAPANGGYLSAANTIKLATNSNGRLTIDSSGNATFTGTCTATTFIGALTGNASGSAATVTGAAQTAITSVGTLTGLTVAGGQITANSSNATKYVRMYGAAGTGQWDIYGHGANLRFSDNAAAGYIVFDHRVGIGTTSPSYHLEIKGSGTQQLAITTTDAADAVLRLNNSVLNWDFDNDGNGTVGSGAAGTLHLRNSSLGDAAVMSFTAAGNVGVGVTSPDQLLHVSDTSNGAAVNPFRLTNTGGSASTEVRMEFECGVDEIATISAKNEGSDTGPLIFSTATTQNAYPSEKVRITKNGHVGIGSNSPHDSSWGTSSTTKFLHIKGSNYGVLSIEGSNGANTKWSIGAGDGRLYHYMENDAAHVLDLVRSTKDVEAAAGNFVLRAANKGIDFTGGGSVGTATNILDDYEEGTWTQTATNLGDHTKHGDSHANYTKIGDLVTASFFYKWTGRSTNNGAYGIKVSIPFTSANLVIAGVGSCGCESICVNASDRTSFHTSVYSSVSTASFRASKSNDSELSFNGALSTSASAGYFSGTVSYKVP